MSVVFQDSRLLPWRRVLDNVTLGLRGRRRAGRAAAQALAEVGLAGREKAWPHELSGGEQQRAALARSLVRDPQLLLADEPFGALDALTRIRCTRCSASCASATSPAVLLVTHDVDEAIVLADVVGHEQHGRPVPLAQLLEQLVHLDPRERVERARTARRPATAAGPVPASGPARHVAARRRTARRPGASRPSRPTSASAARPARQVPASAARGSRCRASAARAAAASPGTPPILVGHR